MCNKHSAGKNETEKGMNDSTRSQRVTYARKTCECEQAKSHEAEEVEAI